MDKALRNMLALEEVKKMKRPVIVMNDKDFEELKKQVESKSNIIIGNNPMYMNTPIKADKFIERDKLYIYDNVVDKLL